MTHEEFLRAREILQLSDDQLAADMGLTPHVIAAWTRGSVAVPSRHGGCLAWRAGVKERLQAATAAGIPDCEWLESLDPEEVEQDPGSIMAAVNRHQAGCPICTARLRFDAEHFGPLPSLPRPAWVAPLLWLRRFPPAIRPAVVGAVAAGTLALMRVLMVTRRAGHLDVAWYQSLLGVLGAIVVGALLGFGYGALVRRGDGRVNS